MLSPHRIAAVAAGLLAFFPTAFAQTFSDCDPLLRNDCEPNDALGTYAAFNWTKEAANSKIWNTTSGKVNFTPDGALFTIPRKGAVGPTIKSEFYMFWGRTSIVMKASAGKGVVSSIVMESDTRDEIDWEWIGGNTTHVQSNFFGKGDVSTYGRAIWHPIDNALAEHNYTVVWVKEKMDFYIDNDLIRTIPWDDPLAMSDPNDKTKVGDRYPQSPMMLKLGNWIPMENATGTVEWAGGLPDYSEAPYVQIVKSVEMHDYTQGKLYSYADNSGSWESIQVTAGNSTVQEIISTPQGVNGKFNALPQAAKIGIVIAAIVVAVILAVLMVFCCIKNRRAGRRERAIADAEWERNSNELQQYKRMMTAEEEIHPRAGYI